MYPIIDLGFIGIPTYWLCTIIGILIAELLFYKMARGRHIEGCDVLCSTIYTVLGILIGAKLLYFITVLPNVIRKFDIFLEYPWESLEYLFAGFVFYGGLIGGAIGFCRYCRKFKLPLSTFADSVIPAVPLFHAFGRLGCLLAGCCYGAEYHGLFAITFPINEGTSEMAGVPRFPTQICEIIFNLILVVILYFYCRKTRKPYSSVGLYLVCYAVFRFCIEFMRGDIMRGGFLSLSTSQWISIPLFIFGLFLMLRKQKSDIRIPDAKIS